MATTKPRREGDQLRGELLAAATALAATPRPVAIPSLRAVARACDVSAAAVYRHFPSQAALTRALLTAGFTEIETAVLRADDPALDVDTRMRRLARAYVRWGLTNPGMYQLLFESADQLDPDSTLDADAASELLGLTRALLEARAATRDDAAVRAERLWSGLHGLVSLRVHKPDQSWVSDPESEAEHLIDELP
ncbi:WHG domain-containing protein [Actinoplanes sp. NPDC051494]|uniref:WHG domain-containing protein n=1 Tax=Actinoplanes sp. NPDC051494 TaxID=3363907 RepID=UPI00378895F2